MNLIQGTVYKIEVKSGYGFIQHIESTEKLGEFVRILSRVSKDDVITQQQVNDHERYCIYFPLKTYIYRKVVFKVGCFDIPKSFKPANNMRSEYLIRGEFICWHIVDRHTWKRKSRKRLNKREMRYSQWGIWNDKLLVNRINQNWTLEEWV